LALKSSSTLGTGNILTNIEKRERDEDLEVRRAFDGTTGNRRRTKDNYAVMHVESGEDDDDSDGELRASPGPRAQVGLTPDDPIDAREPMDVEVVDSSDAPFVSAPPPPPPAAVGGALKRNADGSVVAPRIKTKSKDKKVALISPLVGYETHFMHRIVSRAGGDRPSRPRRK
jgi:ATP-dependent RNA helicase DHX37/DHR1